MFGLVGRFGKPPKLSLAAPLCHGVHLNMAAVDVSSIRAAATCVVLLLAKVRCSYHAGNNELEPALGWFPESRQNPILYAMDFAELFVHTVREAVREARPTVPSPSIVSTADEPWHVP